MPSFSKLPRSFYLRPTITVAKELLGCYLVRRVGPKQLAGRIVEVEAYLGTKDPASHTFNGKTLRNEVMFKQGGHLYVYFTYGMHYCANVVTEDEGIGHAVLLRAVEPVGGITLMRKNRKRSSDQSSKGLTDGPAKICQAFDIGRNENGTDLLGRAIFVARSSSQRRMKIRATRRIGIRKAIERRLRFVIAE